jgi:hypothetical protein
MTNKPNDGKRLEKLVSLVEGMDLPSGFTVETNKPVYEDGKQIAELDILVSGTIGTVSYKTLFECRDRPSEGAQGASWIEQLLGRRERLQVSAIVAVSTTGFAPGAEKFADERNIFLRHVEELTIEEIQGWLPMRAPVVYREASFTEVKLVVIPEDQTMDQIQSMGAEHERIEITTEGKIFRNIDSQEQLSLLDLWRKLIKEQETELFADIKYVGDTAQKIVRVADNVLKAHVVELPDRRGKIHELIYTAKVCMYPSQVPLAYCVNYDDRHVVAHWEGDQPGEDNFTVILTKKSHQQE